MNDLQSSDMHSKLVKIWEEKSAAELTQLQHLRLLELGILTLEQTASRTLSNVTLLVIIDRVIRQCIPKHPVLSYISLESNSLSFENRPEIDSSKALELMEALRFLLIELLTVLGRITAEILTKALHYELLKVTWTEPEKT
jgi:hypothetical protein